MHTEPLSFAPSKGSLSSDSGWQVPEYEFQEFARRSTQYCVCIPVLNEGQRIRRELTDMVRCNIAAAADILILDGGSTDSCVEPDFLASHGVRGLLTKRGPGRLGAQLRMGYAHALREGYEGIVTIDGNDKDGVEAIPAFVRALRAGYDLVQGSRFLPGGEAVNTPLSRLIAIKTIHAPLINLGARFRYTDTTNGFRAYSRRFLLDPRVQPFREVFSSYELLAYLSVRGPRTGFRTTEIPVSRRYPKNLVPTKISLFGGNLELIRVLLKSVSGKFNP